MCVMRSKVNSVLLITLVFFQTACATLFRNADYNLIVQPAGFNKSFLKTKHFALTSYHRFNNPGEPLNIYIEGDGRAWISKTQLSDNPTPQNPLVLELVGIDPSANVAYLARPGQYTEHGVPLCEPAYWSNKRFSEEVISSINEAIDQLCLKAKSKKINLIGYSGGAAIAVLVTARRTDVISLRTIAGNLDTEAVNRYNNVSPLSGSLNPIEVANRIKDIPQRHFIGAYDKVIPSTIAQAFVLQEGDKDYKRITIIEGATHTRGWRERWKELLSVPL